MFFFKINIFFGSTAHFKIWLDRNGGQPEVVFKQRALKVKILTTLNRHFCGQFLNF
jgi:hypothetical protein